MVPKHRAQLNHIGTLCPRSEGSRSHPQLVNMKEKFYVALGLCIPYLSIDETFSLLATSKSAQSLRDSVREVVLNRTIDRSSKYLSCVGKYLHRVTNLELQSVRSYPLNFQYFPNLTHLKLDSTEHVAEPELVRESKVSTVKALHMKRASAASVQCALDFTARFSSLTTLTLDRFVPMLVIQIQELIGQLPQLQELNISQCFTDRNPLVLVASSLRTLSIRNCPNMIGLHLQDSPKLTTCEIINCPISSRSVESLLSCPVLRTLRVEKCSLLQHRLNLKHKRLQFLSLRGCINLTDLRVDCVRLENIDVQLCSSLITCTIRSDYLRSVDVSQLRHLCALQLDCPLLRKLELVGCENVGARDRRSCLERQFVSLPVNPSQTESSDSEDSDLESVTNSENSYPIHLAPASKPQFEEESDNDLPGEHMIRQLGLTSPHLDLKHLVEEESRATALYAQREHLLEIVSQYCTSISHGHASMAARVTPINRPARRGRGSSPRSPRSEVKVKKPNRRAARRRASA